MGTNNQKENLLSSWKEIAAYLKCGVRSCIRWEKEAGLPIHQAPNAPKSRVYAYKNELDEWLKKKRKIEPQRRKSPRRALPWRKGLYLIIPLLIILSCIVTFAVLTKKTELPKKPNPSGVPQSTGPLTLKEDDIVTTEFGGAGRLRVWRQDGARAYKEAWRIEPVRHASLAVGNLDNENDLEIVAPGYCRESEQQENKAIDKWRYFLNIYKPGFKDWWKTTFYNIPDCIYEYDWSEFNEISVGDVDGDSFNEVVLGTIHSISVFKYDQKEKEFKLLASRKLYVDTHPIFLKSISLADIDEDDAQEILVAADEWKGQEASINSGWLLIMKVRNSEFEVIDTIAVDASFVFQSLRTGDVIPGGTREIVALCYRKSSGMWNSFVLIWNAKEKKFYNSAIENKEADQQPKAHLDVGNLLPYEGDEIVLGTQEPPELRVYSLSGITLREDYRMHLDKRVSMTNVFIEHKQVQKDAIARIIACGASGGRGEAGKFYLELFHFRDGFSSKWRRMFGEKEELRVSYAAFGSGLR